MSDQESYCEGIIEEIGFYYQDNILLNITIPLCLVGMILNLLNLLVFTRITMNSPPNLILTHLAFVDFLYLLTCIVHFWVVAFQSDFDIKQSYVLTLVYRYSDISTTMFQFISIFLTVQLAAWRYIAVVHPLKERHWCSKKITRNVVITGYVVCNLLSAIPEHLSFDIETYEEEGNIYYEANFDQHPIMSLIDNIIYGLVIRILPSVVLTGLTFGIVITLSARKTKREQLTQSSSATNDTQNVEMRRQTNRSTAILLSVVALFFIAEFPKGILWLLPQISDHFNTCYSLLGNIFFTISNINASITFIVYYTLSQQFRTTFKSLFNRNPRTMTHQIHTPRALSDTKETDSRWKTSKV